MEELEKEWISLYHGMELDPIADNTKRNNENGIYFLALYYMFKYKKGMLTEDNIKTFETICENIRTHLPNGEIVQGVFDRGQDESLTEPAETRRSLSHDNLTGISNFSGLFGLKYAKEIAEHGLKNFFIYDNITPENQSIKRFRGHPAYISNWLHNAGHKVKSLMLSPFLLIHSMISCSSPKEETSGKLLTICRLYLWSEKSMVYKFIWNIVKKQLKKMYGDEYLSEICNIYFKNPDHPIHNMVRGLK